MSWVSRLVMCLRHRLRQMKGEAELGELLLSATKGQAALAAQRSLLEQCLPRSFLTAWHPLPTTSAALRLTLAGHTDLVHGCAVSPAGDFIVSASGGRDAQGVGCATGACLLVFPVEGALTGCVFHPDGKHLVACGT